MSRRASIPRRLELHRDRDDLQEDRRRFVSEELPPLGGAHRILVPQGADDDGVGIYNALADQARPKVLC